ncbi:50S ribosomal protein L11 methyltransferase [Anaerotruncus sp. 80]|jgi:ribosomal protein L11 methyltransferase|uniref:Ribosomal protein L11 methyltransferase n=1 Tax=Anaerotruncus colihominis TaxID=169435 RepID=A0A845QEV1_9FIRM|nr:MULTISPECIES: 50S ribosomal protein L11 methyltransferase [Eubacteriales]NBH60162.1 50S ribosomal protein L11 methyltransferase [Anaerotruncus colihominis]NCF00816.1 50S ribosomal protein L11 methyltransferase [Anaerotruncus sp. 80]
MKYLEINIETSAAGIEPVVSALLNLGITDTVVEDPRDIEDLMDKKQTYDWDYLDDSIIEKMKESPKVTVYLEDTEENRTLAEQIAPAMEELRSKAREGIFGEGADFGSLRVSKKQEDDTQWKDKWKEYFKPARIAENIVVKPTWESYERQGDEKVIEIDPGMAFGTGTHETTSLCVKMLEKYQKESDKVLDVGCGSGILSIAAALLGAEDVLGVDIDPVAVEVAAENIELNGVANVAKAQYGDLTKGIDYKADIVVANLMADLVMMLSEDVARHMQPGGLFISSGILVEKEVQVTEHLRSQGFGIVEVREDGGWCCIVCRK